MPVQPNLLLVGSAAVHFAGALALLFAPQELLAWAGATPSTLAAVLLQVIGSASLGFAMLDWLQRHSLLGGVFGRPLVVANLAYAGSAALSLAHVAIDSGLSVLLSVALALYGSLAIGFGWKLLARPSGATS